MLTGHAGPVRRRTLRLETLAAPCAARWHWPDASGFVETASGSASGHLCDPRSPPFLRVRRSGKYAFHFPKSVESHLASSAGGREDPKPSLPLKLHHQHKCANTTKWSLSCARVLAFSQLFFEALLALSICICSMKCHLEAHVGLELIW
jgi:hypothetical protein